LQGMICGFLGASPWELRAFGTMKFVLQINEGPYQHQASDTAYQFAKAALATGHEVMRVFFFHDGVNNGSRLTTPPQDDRNIVQRWSEMAQQHGVDLVLCIAAAQRRGVVDTDGKQRLEKDADNLAPGFRISGLGQLIEGIVLADRLMVFGD